MQTLEAVYVYISQNCRSFPSLAVTYKPREPKAFLARRERRSAAVEPNTTGQHQLEGLLATCTLDEPHLIVYCRVDVLTVTTRTGKASASHDTNSAILSASSARSPCIFFFQGRNELPFGRQPRKS